MKKIIKESILCFGIVASFLSAVYSQESPVLEKLQTEVSNLIHLAKFSVVTISAKTSHCYTIEDDAGILSLFRESRKAKKDNLWKVGSGIIYDSNGYIITRSSYLADFEAIEVKLYNNQKYEAEYIGTDEKTGLALLKITAGLVEPPKMGDSDALSLYSLVMVLGNSMGISPFASFGLISGYTPEDILILSAPINPGNIGGPVFNLKGEIVGIVTAQLVTDVSFSGPAFMDYSHQNSLALPINQICQIIDNIIKMNGEDKGWLGVELYPDSLKTNKIVLKSVIPGSPADRVGLKKGDQLLKYNEIDLNNNEHTGKLIEETKPGTSVSINFIRDNRSLNVFPCLDKKWPESFNPRKPQSLSPIPLNQNDAASVQFPVIFSPSKFRQLNSRMIQMENEIRNLKIQLQKHQ
jgi:S1-C subfamily serine protease